MISAPQIRAARGLLNWTQADLARAAGLHVNGINNIEREVGSPRVATMEKLQHTLEAEGVRFRAGQGVELEHEKLEIQKFEGPHYLRDFTVEILQFLKGPADEIFAVMADDRMFGADVSANDLYMKESSHRGFRERTIVGPEYGAPFSKTCYYRWLPSRVLGKLCFAVFSDRFCLINWESQEIILIRSRVLADTYRRQFEFMWSQAKPLLSAKRKIAKR